MHKPRGIQDEGGASLPTLAVDDVLMTGRTMDKLLPQIRRLTGQDARVEAYPLLRIDPNDKAAADRIHREFALTLALNQVPYFSDFAMSHLVKSVSPGQVQTLLGDTGWRTVEVTGAPVVGHRAGACSLFLGDVLGQQFFDGIGPMRNLISVVKVRMFYTFDDNGFTLRFVPIVLTEPLAQTDLAQWLTHADINLGIGRHDQPDVLAAAAGLVTMILSAKLMEVFGTYVNERHSLNVSQDMAFVDLILGEALRDKASVDRVGTLDVFTHGEDAGGFVRTPPEPQFKWGEKVWKGDHGQVGDDVLRSFYAEILKTRPDDTGRDKERVVSVHELAKRLNLSPEAVSTALDVGNDGGWCVPAYDAVGDSVERVLRAAERTMDYEILIPGRSGGRLAAILESRDVDYSQKVSGLLPDLTDLDQPSRGWGD